MSTSPVLQFREAVQASPAMQTEIRALAERGAFDPVAFGGARGYTFTRADLTTALEQLAGRLTDFELELIGRQARSTGAVRDLAPRGDVVGGATSTQRLDKNTSAQY
jgi:hypothetical protein